VELAALRVSLGRSAEAVPLLEEALRLEPRFLEAWLCLARAHLEAGRMEQAAGAMRGLEIARDQLRGYSPKNGYERDLVRLDADRVAWIIRRLQPVNAAP
jgi:hypothetical protein